MTAISDYSGILSDIVGKRVLVTGSTSGIGAALALELAKLGAQVVVHGNKSVAQGHQLIEQMKEFKVRAHLVLGDIAMPAMAPKIVSEAAEFLGGMDVLVNNAGGLITRQTNAAFQHELYQQVFGLNVSAIYTTTQAALPYLMAAHGASIINTGSVAGRTGGTIGSTLYASSKAAVHAMTRNMAHEFAPHSIRVNTVAPGFIETPFHSETPQTSRDSAMSAIALKRLGTPQECVGAYIFLMSNTMSGYVTGQIIDVNGGQVMP